MQVIIAHLAKLPATVLFAHVPVDGFGAEDLRARFSATRWDPLLWAAPWLWRLSGNAFLDQSPDDFGDSASWSRSTVLQLMAEYREAQRVICAIDAFDNWLLEAPAERVRAAIATASGPPTNRLSTLLDLPIVARQAASSSTAVAATS